MAKITWDESYSVGVRLIDGQHKKLFGILNAMDEGFAGGRGQDPAFLEEVIYDLEAYVEFHFGEEEKYFQKFCYPEAETHIKEHRLYEEKIREFHEKYLEGGNDFSQEMLAFLENWIASHIKAEDKKYSACFREHGLK